MSNLKSRDMTFDDVWWRLMTSTHPLHSYNNNTIFCSFSFSIFNSSESDIIELMLKQVIAYSFTFLQIMFSISSFFRKICSESLILIYFNFFVINEGFIFLKTLFKFFLFLNLKLLRPRIFWVLELSELWTFLSSELSELWTFLILNFLVFIFLVFFWRDQIGRHKIKQKNLLFLK